MFFKKNKTKKSTTAKAEIIDIDKFRKPDSNLVGVQINLPPMCQAFWQKHNKHIVQNIMPLIIGMMDENQSCFMCEIQLKGRTFNLSVAEDLGANTPTDCLN